VPRLFSPLARGGLGIGVALLALAVLRLDPVGAHAPLPWRARSLALPVLLLAVLAALTARERPARGFRPLAMAAGVLALGLFLVVRLREPAGLAAEAVGGGRRHVLRPGAVDLVGADLAALDGARRWSVRWRGPLRVPEGGLHRLWLAGRGRAEVTIDGGRVLVAAADPLAAGVTLPLSAGAHDLVVDYAHAGPGPRLRLGWTTPGGRSEAIPARFLGHGPARWLWTLTDALALACALAAGAAAALAPWPRPVRAAPRAFGLRAVLASAAGHAVVLLAMSWPMARDPATLGPVDRPDGRLNAWIMAWDVHALLHRPSDLFQAPVFHPLPDALAFSEHLLLPALATLPAQLAGGPVLAYNLVLLGSALGAALGVQALVLRGGGTLPAAFAAGALFAAGPHRWVNLPHLHAHAVLFLPFVALLFDRFWERRTVPRALAVAAALALQALTSIYVAALCAVLLACAMAVALAGGMGWRAAARLAAALVLAAGALFPLARPYFRMRAALGEEFRLADVSLYATTPESYLASGVRWYGGLGRRHLEGERVRDPLFPGLTLLVLGVAGLAAAPPRYRAVALLCSTVAVVLSLGPATGFYRFLHEHVVLFRGIRALGRFASLPVLCLAVLAGFALSARRAWSVGLVLALGLAEACAVPVRLGRYTPPPETARGLAGGPGAVVSLPVGEDDTQAMLDATAHFRPLVNGDSGFVPRPYVRVQELLGGPLDADGLRLLRALGVTQVVARSPLGLPLATVHHDGTVGAVPPGEPAREVAAGAPVCTLWTPSGAWLDTGGPRDVERVAFEPSDQPWCARPAVHASLDGRSWRAVPAEARLSDAAFTLLRRPRDGRAEVRFAPTRARFLRLDPCLPARPGALEVGP
jgi:hypothetical protein